MFAELEMKLHALILSTLDACDYFSFARRSLHTRRERQSVFIKIYVFTYEIQQIVMLCG